MAASPTTRLSHQGAGLAVHCGAGRGPVSCRLSQEGAQTWPRPTDSMVPYQGRESGPQLCEHWSLSPPRMARGILGSPSPRQQVASLYSPSAPCHDQCPPLPRRPPLLALLPAPAARCPPALQGKRHANASTALSSSNRPAQPWLPAIRGRGGEEGSLLQSPPGAACHPCTRRVFISEARCGTG